MHDGYFPALPAAPPIIGDHLGRDAEAILHVERGAVAESRRVRVSCRPEELPEITIHIDAGGVREREMQRTGSRGPDARVQGTLINAVSVREKSRHQPIA